MLRVQTWCAKEHPKLTFKIKLPYCLSFKTFCFDATQENSYGALYLKHIPVDLDCGSAEILMSHRSPDSRSDGT